MIKITLKELNQAYTEANKFKVNGYPIRESVEVDIERSISTMGQPLNDSNVFTTFVKIKFVLDNNLGPNGSYVLHGNVEVIDIED